MSEEYIGKNGQLVGSAAYFEEINKKCVMVGVFTDCRDHHYSDQLDAFCTKITNGLSEIHEDLKTNARVLPYIPDEPKKELAKFIKSLDDVIISWGKGMTRAYECISLLELRDYATRPKSGADIRKILNVVDEIQGERFFRAGDIVEIIKKAKDYGIKNVSGEEAQIEYIMGLCGEDRDFYDDVFVPLCYRNRIKTFEGKRMVLIDLLAIFICNMTKEDKKDF